MSMDDVLALERAGWRALTTEGEAAGFYEEVLADDVLFLLPGGMGLDDRAAAVRSMAGVPWDEHELAEERVVPLGSGAAVVAYRARARRGEDAYEAWCASTYVLVDGGWRLAVHQQTPVAVA
jgi:hypothetical protein